MSEEIRIFKSPDSKAQYDAAYEAMLEQWPVSYEELYIPTGFGDTHVIASGPQDSSPLALFHSAGSGAMQWFRTVFPATTYLRRFTPTKNYGKFILRCFC